MSPVLEVIALSADDALAAQDAGADRVELLGTMDHDGLSPSAALVEQTAARVSIGVRAMVRLDAGFGADPGAVNKLARLVRDYRSAGADGLVLGFLDAAGAVDAAVCEQVLDGTPLPWTFHRAIDASEDRASAWPVVRDHGCDQVLTAGYAQGLGAGVQGLAQFAQSDPESAPLILAGGGLAPEHVPVLAQAGVRGFHIGSAARPGRSFDEHVDPALVRPWRDLVNDACS